MMNESPKPYILKEARHKSVHFAWFCLHEAPELTKLSCGDSYGGGRVFTGKRREGVYASDGRFCIN